MKTLDLYITQICNLNCEYCYVELKNNEDTFNLKNFSQKVNLLEYDHIKFFGGEPLLKWKEIQTIILLVQGKNIKCSIITNGLLLDKQKVIFCLKYEVDIVLSMHFKVIRRTLSKINKFGFANKILGFLFIFEEGKIDFPYKIVSILVNYGFTNFILTPEVYSNWSAINLDGLQKELNKFIQLYKQNTKLKFTGPSENTLPKLIKGCSKFVYTKEGVRKPCNRFKNLDSLSEHNIVKIYKQFETIIDYENDPDKWFYVCPIGWYLDTLKLEGNFEKRVQEYKSLNQVFIKFYRTINTIQGKINFLTKNIDEIRFNLTSQCNIRCNYCYLQFKNHTLDFEVAKNIINFFVLKEGKEKHISFFGGEPLLEFNNLKKIVEYANTVFTQKNKHLNFKIATNFLLINSEKLLFLKKHNFEIHISFNGKKEINDSMRDNSSEKLLNNLTKYLTKNDKKEVIILLAFSNQEIEFLVNNICYIYNLGFYKINLEMIFGNKYNWGRNDFIKLQKEFLKIKKLDLPYLQFQNIGKKNISLDISVEGKSGDNSLEFYEYQADFKKQKQFKRLLELNFKKPITQT